MLAVLPAARAVEPDDAERFNASFQSTYVWQTKPAFGAAYSGPNSLSPVHEKSYSFTATAAFGWRPWAAGPELYFDPELVQGVPMSGLVGLGGLTNGELQKTAGSNPVLYKARLFLRQRFDLGGPAEPEPIESDFNQLAGRQSSRRLVLTAGNLAVSDLFDNNGVAHDARTQFLNWALLTHGAYDFAADSRGYSVGAALAYDDGDWSLRAGRFAMPTQSNGLMLDWNLARHHGDQIELEHRHRIGARAGVARLLLFRNVARSGSFDDALQAAAATGTVPVLADVRRDQAKRGWGIAAEQELADGLNAFARWGASDGRSEPYAFAAIDRSASAGAVLNGAAWQRAADRFGLAYARNGLSGSHRRFLAAGGSDFFLGDGALRYASEQTVEAYYSAALANKLWLSFDAQRIRNPAYNADRGPVRACAVRLHAEY